MNDPESGLVYMQARYYDPAVGRFLSTDPVGPSPGGVFGFNRYDYANNNPILNIDPNGKGTLPLFFQLNWFHQVEKQAVDEDIKQPIQNLPSRQEAATSLDQINLVATGTALVGSEIPPLAGIAGLVDESTAVGAFVLDPTPARAANVMTLGAFSMLKVAVKTATLGEKVSEQAMKSVGHAEMGRDAGELIKAGQETHERQEQNQPAENGQKAQMDSAIPVLPPPPAKNLDSY